LTLLFVIFYRNTYRRGKTRLLLGKIKTPAAFYSFGIANFQKIFITSKFFFNPVLNVYLALSTLGLALGTSGPQGERI